jgi:hypothetical protein
MAARYLRMSRKTLIYRIHKYDLLKFGPLRMEPNPQVVM